MCSIKEPHYFSFGAGDFSLAPGRRGPVHSWVKSREEYLKLFANDHGARVGGESSVSYLYVPGTAERIREFNPEMKLIVSLRNPVDRAWSSFNAAKSYGTEPLKTLAEGLAAEPQRIQEDGSILLRYRDLGLYSSQLARYYEVFPRDQIKVILYEDFVQEPERVVRELCEFIGVSPDFQMDPDLRSNETRRPNDANPLHNLVSNQNFVRSALRKLLPMSARQRLREIVRYTMFKPPPAISMQERRQFADLFREDIRKLQILLDRDMSVWSK